MTDLTIWKFTLADGFHLQSFDLPSPARIISAGVQGQDIVIWVTVNPRSDVFNLRRFVQVVPTGGTVPQNSEIIDTVFLDWMVFHVFEVTRV
jgi:hypothetical protein